MRENFDMRIIGTRCVAALHIFYVFFIVHHRLNIEIYSGWIKVEEEKSSLVDLLNVVVDKRILPSPSSDCYPL